MVFEETPQQFYLHKWLKSNFDIAIKVVKKDWDMVFVIDGTEGGGKSVLAQQVAKYCDPTLTIDRIVFTPHQFKDAVMKAEKYQAIVYDEAYAGLGSRGTMSHVNIMLVKMLTEIRQKNLFIFIVLPTFFDLDKYVALWRSRALIHVYATGKFERGQFAFYNKQQKKLLYIEGKKLYSYKKPRPAFIGRFTNHYTVDKKEYLEKKRNSTVCEEDEIRTATLRISRELREKIAVALQRNIPGLTQTQIGLVMGVARETVNRYLKKEGIEQLDEQIRLEPREMSVSDKVIK